jgi:hypothetical protein
MDDLSLRLELLERRLRTWKLATVAAVVLSGAGLLLGAAAAPEPVKDELRTRRLVIEDKAGETLIEIGEEGGEATLSFFDPASRDIRMSAGMLKAHPYINLTMGKGKPNATLAIIPGEPEDLPRLSISGLPGNRRVHFP